MIEPKKIGIIGIHGGFGQALRRLCEQMGNAVIGSDLKTDLSNQDVVFEADVVIFSVLPLETAFRVIEEMIPYSRPEQLWIDISSLKEKPVQAMMRSRAEVLGLHPLFAPQKKGETWSDRTVAVHHARVERWRRWVTKFLQETGARTVEVEPARHDHAMLGVQNLVHLLNLAYGMAIQSLNLPVDDLLDFATVGSRRLQDNLEAMLRQPPHVYSGMQFLNPKSLAVINTLLAVLAELRMIIEGKSQTGFDHVFARLDNYFDPTSSFTGG